MKPRLQRRNGFSLVEVTLTSGLTVFLAVVLSTTWALLIRPTADAIAWGQLFQEMDIAVTAIARDLGGSQPDYADPIPANPQRGGKKQGLLIECKTSNDSFGDHLLLCFDGGDAPDGTADWEIPTDDTIVDYYVDNSTNTLIRWNQKTNTTFTVAKNVAGMTIVDDGNLQITLTFTHSVKATNKTLTRKCTLTAKKNP